MTNYEYIQSLVPILISQMTCDIGLGFLSILPESTIGPGPNGELGFSWELNNNYYALEIMPVNSEYEIELFIQDSHGAILVQL